MQPFCPLKSYHHSLAAPAILNSLQAPLLSLLLACFVIPAELASELVALMAASRTPRVLREATAASCADANTTFVQADPDTFRALVQKLTGAPAGTTPAAPPEKKQQQEEDSESAKVTIAQHAPRRPKLQERRRAAPARLELARPQQPSSASFYYYYYHHHHGHHGLMHSPVSPMDAYVLMASSSSPSSMTPSPHSSLSSPSCGGVVVISKEEEEREEKAIASKGFYLHASPRTRSAAAGDGDRPKLLPLFPVHSPRSAAYYAS
nr:unnamed protein product [Digitaria exilis]